MMNITAKEVFIGTMVPTSKVILLIRNLFNEIYYDLLSCIGAFVDGMKHGVGINHDSKGDDYEEEWKFDELVRRSLVSPYKRRSLNMTPNASDGEESNELGLF